MGVDEKVLRFQYNGNHVDVAVDMDRSNLLDVIIDYEDEATKLGYETARNPDFNYVWQMKHWPLKQDKDLMVMFERLPNHQMIYIWVGTQSKPSALNKLVVDLRKIQDNANGSLEVIYNGSTEVSDHVGKPKKLPVRRNVRTKQLKEVTESSVVVENQVSEVIKEKNSATKVTDDVNDDLNNDRIETHIKTFVFTGMDGLDIELAYQPCILR
ncbi:uncharacterized protein LOC104893193 [Beta vulgaris subsp. vulgaris]|uniref:uncharacterized protein LOC104893193 n=1 Tax=Beta vulgaris subsp. vulgaris TaxID=3555 RepID=UPI0005402B45|nr:uncharacterized protein LOC104893193 [Beta vulgaris subsp. vulgaris]